MTSFLAALGLLVGLLAGLVILSTVALFTGDHEELGKVIQGRRR